MVSAPSSGFFSLEFPLTSSFSPSQIWYIAAHSLACTSRRVCRELWTPEKEENGIPIASLRPLIDALAIWRDEHLSKVGVPSVWPATWDFVAAVTACESKPFVPPRRRPRADLFFPLVPRLFRFELPCVSSSSVVSTEVERSKH